MKKILSTFILTAMATISLAAAPSAFEFFQAVKYGDRSEVQRLIKAGAGVNWIYDDMTMIMAASDGYDIAMIKLLIDNGAKVNIKTPGNKVTALIYLASLKGGKPGIVIEIMEMLVKAGADINVVDYQKWNTLMHAVNEKNDILMIQFLLRNKININHQSGSGETALYIAARCGHAEIVDVLMKAGANPRLLKREKQFQNAALHAAVSGGHLGAVKAMLDNGADVNIRTKGGFGLQTPLHVAVYNRNVKMVKLILKYKPDLRARDDVGATPLAYAKRGGGSELAEIIGLLKRAGAK